MKATNICILTETYYPVVGGGETQARLLAEGLVAHGSSVIILTRRSDRSLWKTEQFGAVTVHRLPPVGGGQLNKWGLLLTSFFALIRLRRDYDLLFVSGFRRVGISAVLASKLLGKACILKADSLGEMSGNYFAGGLARLRLRPSSLVFKPFLWVQNRILKRANVFVAIASEVAAELRAHGIHQASIHMIPNIVDTRRFCPVTPQERNEVRQKLGIPATEKVVIFTGRLVSYKGLPLLLRVWRDIAGKHNDARLLLVGSGGLDIYDCEAELQEYVSANCLQNSVRFTGNVQNVHEYLQASDIFVFPSENDAFPASLIEAMACGLPVVATPVGAIDEIITHEKNGLLVEPRNYGELYDGLETLLARECLAAKLGHVAQQTAREKYSTEVVTREYVELFTRNAELSATPGKYEGSGNVQ